MGTKQHLAALATALAFTAHHCPAQNLEPIRLSRLSALGASAFDSARGRLVSFDEEGKVWEYDGVDRLLRTPSLPGAPSARTGTCLAFDEARRQVVLFGGLLPGTGLPLLNDTWTWDGVAWRQVTGNAPSPRYGVLMAFDSARGRTVLFGGTTLQGNLSETWEFDGAQWTQGTPATVPTGSFPSLVYDRMRNACVLVTLFPVTHWEWNGTNWNVVSPPGLTGPSSGVALVSDPARQRLVGASFSSSFSPGDIWEWDGTTWTRFPGVLPSFGPLWFDAAAAQVAIARSVINGLTIDLAVDHWNGTTLSHGPVLASPSNRIGHALLWGSTGPVLYGGFGGQAGSYVTATDLWRLTGERWEPLTTSSPLPPRSGATTAQRLNGSVIFGSNPGPTAAEFWSWDGSTWQQLPSGPTPRSFGAMAADPFSQQVVLFGGTFGFGNIDDTWTFDGTSWQQRFPANHPSARAGAAMAYDLASGRVILAAGIGIAATSVIYHRETWAWDGTNWSQLAPPTSPTGFGSSTMMLDWSSGHLLLAGTQPDPATAATADELWDYDGFDWRLVAQATPAFADGARAVFDITRNEVVQSNGMNLRRWTRTPTLVDLYGTACGAPAPRLAMRSRPWAGALDSGLEVQAAPNLPFAIALDGAPAQVPLGNGCTLLLANPTIQFLGLLDARGFASLVATVPSALNGQTVHAQGAVLDPAQPGGFATTAALRISIGS